MQPNKPVRGAATESPDPYQYGWRYVQTKQPDGSVTIDQIPLTLEDVLHPEEEDEIVHTRIHELICRYLADVFNSRHIVPAIVSVTADLRIDWGVAGVRPMSPDIGVFVGLEQEPELEEGTFYLAKSGGRCLLALEVVSPNTRENDVEHKMRLYHRTRVQLYILIDQEREGAPRVLLVYRWEPGGFVRQPLDAQGRYLLSALGLYLQVRGDRVVCLDAATGRELGDYTGLVHELEEADRRIQAQEEEIEQTSEQLRQSRKHAQQQAEALEQAEKLARQKAEALEQAEKLARQQAEKLQAEAKRIADLEAQLAQLQQHMSRPG